MCSPALKEKFSAKNFDSISTDTHINHSVIPVGSPYKNATRTVHLNALLDQDAFVGPGHVGCHHPCGGATRSRPGSWIFAVVEHHASMQPRSRVQGLASHEVKKLSARAFQIFRGTVEVTLRLRIASNPRIGTIVNGTPVDTV